jgi:hypothetical protein
MQARLDHTRVDKERRKKERDRIRAKAQMIGKVVRLKVEPPEVDHDEPHEEPTDNLMKITTRFLTLLHMEALGTIRAAGNVHHR